MSYQEVRDVQDLNAASLMREIWAVKVFLIFGALAGLATAFVLIKVSVPQYQARMMIGPTQQIEVSAQGSAANGADAALYYGGSQGQGSGRADARFTNFEAIYSGASVARLLLRDERILRGLSKDQLFGFSDAKVDWSGAELAAYIEKRVWLDAFGETELRSLNYRHHDPVFAAYFLQQIHRTADQIIRADLRDDVDQRIEYLERAIAKTLNPEHRRAITGLLLEQERVRMVVSLPEPVAAKVIEDASSLPKPVWPDMPLLFVGFGVLGAFLGFVFSGLFNDSRRSASYGGY